MDDDRLTLLVELVTHLADDLFDRVFQGDHPDDGAELVHDERDMAVLLTQSGPQLGDRQRLGDGDDGTHDLVDTGIGTVGCGEVEVAKVDDADDVVTGLDREPGVRRLDDRFEGRRHGQVVADGHEPASGRHDLADHAMLDVEDAREHVALAHVDQAAGGALAVEIDELFGRVDVGVPVVGLEAPPLHERERRPVEDRHERPEQELADPHRAQRRHGEAFRVPQRRRLGEQLAEDDLERRDEDQHHDDPRQLRCVS